MATERKTRAIAPLTKSRWLSQSRLFGDLKSRILGALLLLSMVSMALLSSLGYYSARQGIIEITHKQLVSLLVARKALLVEWIEERTHDIELLVFLLTLPENRARILPDGSPGAQEAQLALRDLVDLFQLGDPSYDSLTVYDPHWNEVIQATQHTHEREDFLNDWFKSMIETTEGSFFDVVHKHSEGSVGLHIGRSILTDKGDTIGYLVANLNLTKSVDPLLQDRGGLGKTGKAYIMSSLRLVMTDPFPRTASSRIALRKRGDRILLKDLDREQPTIHVYKDFFENTVLGTAVKIPFEDWILVAEMDKREALAWLNTLLLRTLAITAITLLLVFFVSTWISGLLGKPMKELARVAHRIQEGHVNERLAPMSGQETEEVRQAFNLMLDELHARQKEIVRTATLASVGELSSSIVHEMRNPLTSVKTNLQALGYHVQGDAHYRELSDIATKQVIRVENMLTELLYFGRPLELQRQRLCFEELSKMTLDVVRDMSRANEVEIHVEDTLGAKLLYLDKEQMCRGLSDLLINAIQASPLGSSVVLRAWENIDGIFLEVRDTGSGLAEEALREAFKPFFSTKPGGTGLGLANVKKIVDLHGGSVSVENHPEGGALFIICLPDREESPPPPDER